ncbi:MAG: SusD/RagB family nutrient-binding outer membrane lipoprotein [Flavobacteriaceae bacterium]
MKKIRNNISKYAVLLALTATPLVITSCRQELDINVDPNNPSQASLSGLLSASQVGFAFALGGEGTRMPASIVQHYAGHRAQPLDYAQYRITSSATDGTWTALYNTLMDMKEMENKAAASGNQAYLGVSKILQAHAFSVITDLFGDIPFSQALQGRTNITPVYDKQEDIYPALITMIDEGVAALTAATETISGDIVYGGDVTKWKKYGNSLKLRLLNHLSSRQPNAAANFLTTNPSLIDTSVDDAKVLFGSVASNANPIYQFDVLSGRKDQAVASTIVDKMKALSDPRVSVYFEPVAGNALGLKGQYLGNAPGNDTEDSQKNRYSRVGSAYASIKAPVVLMSAAEVNFIKAEVYYRASNAASAQAAYQAAITQDFAALGLSSSSAATYLANANVAYNGTLQRIMEQKWITMFQASYESWVDWRRTGFPVLTPAANNMTSNVIPRNLPYPEVEINSNRANLEAGPGIPIPYTGLSNRVWWDN